MAKEVIDLMSDLETGDLVIEAGDFVKGDATEIHQKNMLLANKGEYKQFPTTGVGLNTFVLDDSPGQLERTITEEFEGDGMKINKLVFPNIDAEYL